jgi:hypothetical protein
MDTDDIATGPTRGDAPWMYRAGAWSALTIGLAYLVIIGLYATVGAPPAVSDGAVWLRYMAGKTATWSWILGLSVLTDCLFLPVSFALYFALRGVHRDAMLVAAALMALFVVLDLAVTWSHYGSLLTLSRAYESAATDVQRATLVAAATYASAFLTSPLLAVYAIVTLSTGILVAGGVMLRGGFGRMTAYVGLATGVLGALTLTGSSLAVILNALFATIWVFLVGMRLWRLAPTIV